MVDISQHLREQGERSSTTNVTIQNATSEKHYSIPFRWTQSLKYASTFCGDRSTIRIALLNDDLYLIHGAKNVAEALRTSSLTVTLAYGIALRHCFGMAEEAAQTYFADTSGSQSKPIWGSSVHFQGSVSYQTHENLLSGLLGIGLVPATNRFQKSFTKSLCSLNIGQDWEDFPDLLEFFEDHVGTAIIESVFGSVLLSQNPNFIRELWAYDKVIMDLARRIPPFWIPGAYEVRKKLLLSIREWHRYARAQPNGLSETHNEDSDLAWGSKMMRDRHKMLLAIDNQDHDSVASTDLGLIWATATNVVPSSMTLALQVFCDKSILSEIREGLTDTLEPGTHGKFDLRKLDRQPLLSSMYAETLRFGVQIHIPRCSPHRNFNVGQMLIPKQKLMLVSTYLAHTDQTVWNTKNDAFPLNTFWPRRFLVDSKDPLSGPCRKVDGYGKMKNDINGTGRPIFSTEGLEGAWIPFGGGHHACPGRVLAKRIMLLTCAILTNVFDIEILAEENALEFGSPRFGFGVRKPMGKIPFRIRRRRGVTSREPSSV